MSSPSPAETERAAPRPSGLQEFVDRPLACMQRLHCQQGDVAVLETGAGRLAFAFSPDGNRRILSDPETFPTQFFPIRGPRNSAQRRLTSGLLSQNGEAHRAQRRRIKTAFANRAIAVYHPQLAALAEELISGWREGEVRDMRAELTRHLLHVAGRVLFGLEETAPAQRIGALAQRCFELNQQAGLAVIRSTPEMSGRYEELLASAVELEQALLELIEQRMATGAVGEDVLALLIAAQQAAGGFDPRELVGQVAVLFGAGNLTTAFTLIWTLILLAQHPRVLADLQAELVDAQPLERLTAEQLDRLPRLERVIKESMRLLPVSVYSPRITARAVRFGAHDLTAGTPVIISQYVTHRRPDLYAEPDCFIPDRWTRLTSTPYTYLPFGAGVRRCPGAPLAMRILKVTLAAMLARFRPTVADGTRIDGRVIATDLAVTSPVPMRLESPADPAGRPARLTGSFTEWVRLPAG